MDIFYQAPAVSRSFQSFISIKASKFPMDINIETCHSIVSYFTWSFSFSRALVVWILNKCRRGAEKYRRIGVRTSEIDGFLRCRNSPFLSFSAFQSEETRYPPYFPGTVSPKCR